MYRSLDIWVLNSLCPFVVLECATSSSRSVPIHISQPLKLTFFSPQSSYTGNSDGSATLHVAQLAPNPALLVPGPALLSVPPSLPTSPPADPPALLKRRFVVINNIPSIGQYVMVGSGTIETQPLLPKSVLPASSLSGKATTSATGATKDSRAGSLFIFDLRSLLAVTLVAITLA